MIYAEMALFEHGNECICSYTICVIIGIGAYFVWKYMNQWYLKKDVIRVKFGTGIQTTI